MIIECDKMANGKDFAQFVQENQLTIRPVILDGRLIGWVTWDGGRILKFWNTAFKNTVTFAMKENIPATYENFLKAIEDIKELIKLEDEKLERLYNSY